MGCAVILSTGHLNKLADSLTQCDSAVSSPYLCGFLKPANSVGLVGRNDDRTSTHHQDFMHYCSEPSGKHAMVMLTIACPGLFVLWHLYIAINVSRRLVFDTDEQPTI